MRIARHRFDVAVSEPLVDDREGPVERKHPGRKAATKVVNLQVLQPPDRRAQMRRQGCCGSVMREPDALLAMTQELFRPAAFLPRPAKALRSSRRA